MKEDDFESGLEFIAEKLTYESGEKPFGNAQQFENRVREVAEEYFGSGTVDFDSPAQAFPDVAIQNCGIEVKFTTSDSWRSVANSVLESNRVEEVEHVYLMFGKMGGEPAVRWGRYEECVMHVRTSHVPRFEVEIGASESLFSKVGVEYNEFRYLPMHEKMSYIRTYARGRLKKGERLWWLEDSQGEEHTLPIQARLYTKLEKDEKVRLRAEAVLLCPRIVDSGRSRDKYDDVVLYLLTYHGVLCHQARDLFSAGSVAVPKNNERGGVYIARAIKILEADIVAAAQRMDSALFEEYWGFDVDPDKRVGEWLKMVDELAKGWVPSEFLFRN